MFSGRLSECSSITIYVTTFVTRQMPDVFTHCLFYVLTVCLWVILCLSVVAFSDEGEVTLQPTHTLSGSLRHSSLFKHTLSTTWMIISAIHCSAGIRKAFNAAHVFSICIYKQINKISHSLDIL